MDADEMLEKDLKRPKMEDNVNTRSYSKAFVEWMHYQQWIQQTNLVSCYYLSSAAYMCGFLKERTIMPTQQTETNLETSNYNYIGRECEIPAIWRRLFAEIIDCFILLLMKVGASLIIMDYVDIIDVDAYGAENFFNLNWDADTVINFTTELIIVELANRICISLFEAICLRSGTNGNIGGATPGKRIMGLRVVSCSNVIKINEKKVVIYPAGNLTFVNCLLRSFIKNFSYLFFFPMSFTIIIFPFRRSAYDIFTGCIVVYVGEEYSHNFRERVLR